MEEWKPIVGFENIYEVSSLGNVRSVERIDPAGRKRPAKLRVLQSGKRGHYAVINLRKNNKTFSKKVHHLVALAFLGQPPVPLYPGQGDIHGFCEVNHIDGDKQNNRPDNLEYCTRRENILHSYKIGLREGASQGERNGRARLNQGQVDEIRRLYASGGYSIPQLGRQFGVGKSTIGYIVQGVTWKH